MWRHRVLRFLRDERERLITRIRRKIFFIHFERIDGLVEPESWESGSEASHAPNCLYAIRAAPPPCMPCGLQPKTKISFGFRTVINSGVKGRLYKSSKWGLLGYNTRRVIRDSSSLSKTYAARSIHYIRPRVISFLKTDAGCAFLITINSKIMGKFS